MANSDPEQVELKTSDHDIEAAESNKPTNPADRPLTKEELEKLADTPFWQRIRWATIVFFWAVWICMLGLTIYIVVNAKADIVEKERALVFDRDLNQIETGVVVYDKLPENEENPNEGSDASVVQQILVISKNADVDYSKLSDNHYYDNEKKNDGTNGYFSKIDETLLKKKLGESNDCKTVSFENDKGLIVHNSDEASAKVMVASRFSKLFVTKNNEEFVNKEIDEFTCKKVDCGDGESIGKNCFEFNFAGKVFKVS